MCTLLTLSPSAALPPLGAWSPCTSPRLASVAESRDFPPSVKGRGFWREVSVRVPCLMTNGHAPPAPPRSLNYRPKQITERSWVCDLVGAEPEVANSNVGERSRESSPGQAAACLDSLEHFFWAGGGEEHLRPGVYPWLGFGEEPLAASPTGFPCFSAETISFCKQSLISAPLGRISQHPFNTIAILSSALQY